MPSDQRPQGREHAQPEFQLRRLLPVALLRGDDRRAFLFAWMVVAEVAIGAALLAVYAPRFEGAWQLLVLLGVLTVLAERTPVEIYHETYISIGFVLTMATMVLLGAPGVVLIAPFEALAGRLGRRPVDYIIPRNAGRFVAVYWAGAQAYALFADVAPSGVTASMLAGGLAATLTTFSLSAILLSVALWLRMGQPLMASWERHRWVGPQYLALGFLGLALAVAYIGLGYIGILAFLAPAFMMRLTMKQYVDKTAEHVEKLKQQNTALEAANVEVRKVSDELRVTYDETLEALVNALDARDQETKGHSVRVARYMLFIAEALGVRPGSQDWIDMQRGALLHDVGKIGVSDSILRKPGKLTEEEWTEMRRHPEIGYRMLREVKFLRGAAEIVLAHHERWDGKGYPRGLREEETPLGSRIFSVVDTFDSMTSDRPYRRALDAKTALDEILRCSGSQFDPLVVEAFLDIYDQWVRESRRLQRPAVAPAA